MMTSSVLIRMTMRAVTMSVVAVRSQRKISRICDAETYKDKGYA